MIGAGSWGSALAVLLLKNEKKSASEISSAQYLSGRTSEALWQKGHLKLHPFVKTVQATKPGKSQSVVFISPPSTIRLSSQNHNISCSQYIYYTI